MNRTSKFTRGVILGTASLSCVILLSACGELRYIPWVVEKYLEDKFDPTSHDPAYDDERIEYTQKDMDVITAAIKKNPKDARLYRNRGRGYYYNDDYKKSLVDYDKALCLDPKNSDWYEERGNVYSACEDRAKAIADFSTAIKINPKDISYYVNRSDEYLKLGKKKQALDDITLGIKNNPGDGYGLTHRADFYLKDGQVEKALEDFKEAAFGSSWTEDGLSGAAKCYVLLGDFDSALVYLDREVSSNEDSSPGLRERAKLQKLLGHTSEALADYRKYVADLKKEIEKDPGEYYNYDLCIAALEEMGDVAGAKQMQINEREMLYEKLSRKDLSEDDRTAKLSTLSTLLCEMDTPESEIRRLEKLFGKEIDKNRDAIEHLRGSIAFRHKDYKVALQHFQNAHKLDPAYAGYSAHVLRCLSILGRHKEALAFAAKVLVADPEDTRLLLVLSEMYISVGDFKFAQKVLDKVKSIDFTEGLRYLQQEKLDKAQGKTEEAAKNHIRGIWLDPITDL